METNTKIGCMAGCLASVGVFIGVAFLFSLIMAVAFRGCSEMHTDSQDAIALAPQDANQFKKVWLSGDGDEDVAHVLKIRISGVMSSKIDRPVFGAVDDTSAPTALRKIKAAIDDESIDGLYLEIDTPGGGVTIADELHDAILRFRKSHEGRFGLLPRFDHIAFRHVFAEVQNFVSVTSQQHLYDVLTDVVDVAFDGG